MAYDAYAVDWDLNTAGFAEDDYVFRAAGTARMPGLPDTWFGRDGYLAAHSTLLEVLDIEAVVLDDVTFLPDGRVAAFVHFEIRTAAGLMEQQFLDVHEFREGAIVSQTVWWDREEGLRELGL